MSNEVEVPRVTLDEPTTDGSFVPGDDVPNRDSRSLRNQLLLSWVAIAFLGWLYLLHFLFSMR